MGVGGVNKVVRVPAGLRELRQGKGEGNPQELNPADSRDTRSWSFGLVWFGLGFFFGSSSKTTGTHEWQSLA